MPYQNDISTFVYFIWFHIYSTFSSLSRWLGNPPSSLNWAFFFVKTCFIDYWKSRRVFLNISVLNLYFIEHVFHAANHVLHLYNECITNGYGCISLMTLTSINTWRVNYSDVTKWKVRCWHYGKKIMCTIKISIWLTFINFSAEVTILLSWRPRHAGGCEITFQFKSNIYSHRILS